MPIELSAHRRAGRTACVMGSAWLVGLGAIFALQRFVWRGHTMLLFPVFALLAAYLAVAGGFQWATGKGGIQPRATGLSTSRTLAVQAGAFVVLGAVSWYVGQR